MLKKALWCLAATALVAGVIGNEAIPSWPAEALEAQAVATRGYAITTVEGGDSGFDQYSDTRSQVYRGVAGETPQTNKATNATAGEVMTYDGDPITSIPVECNLTTDTTRHNQWASIHVA